MHIYFATKSYTYYSSLCSPFLHRLIETEHNKMYLLQNTLEYKQTSFFCIKKKSLGNLFCIVDKQLILLSTKTKPIIQNTNLIP